MNTGVELNRQHGATMSKRVHFASELAAEKFSLRIEDASSSERHASNPAMLSPPSTSWYTSTELRAFRDEIQSSLDVEKAGTPSSSHPHDAGADNKINDPCMRGLEIFASNVRRDLQKHYARSVIEAQRRIRACKKRKRLEGDEEEDSILLQRVAEKCSQYARDRAHEIAVKDEVDSRRLHEEPSSPRGTYSGKERCQPLMLRYHTFDSGT